MSGWEVRRSHFHQGAPVERTHARRQFEGTARAVSGKTLLSRSPFLSHRLPHLIG
jgi:hypothetical protein